MIRFFLYIAVVLSALFLPFWAFVLIAFVYALFFAPHEVIVVGVLIDAQFGEVGIGVWYLYTLATIGIFFVTLYSKPYLSFYR